MFSLISALSVDSARMLLRAFSLLDAWCAVLSAHYPDTTSRNGWV